MHFCTIAIHCVYTSLNCSLAFPPSNFWSLAVLQAIKNWTVGRPGNETTYIHHSGKIAAEYYVHIGVTSTVSSLLLSTPATSEIPGGVCINIIYLPIHLYQFLHLLWSQLWWKCFIMLFPTFGTGITSTVSLPLPSTTTTSGVEGGVSTTVFMLGEETSFKV